MVHFANKPFDLIHKTGFRVRTGPHCDEEKIEISITAWHEKECNVRTSTLESLLDVMNDPVTLHLRLIEEGCMSG